MPGDIPEWPIKQMTGGIVRIGVALQEIEECLKQGDTRRLATCARKIRGALKWLKQDLHSVELFNSGAVQRRDGVR
jgi:hypothetical protein